MRQQKSLRLKEMKKEMRIKVLQSHINLAKDKRGSSKTCPVAFAIKDALHWQGISYNEVNVYPGMITIEKDKGVFAENDAYKNIPPEVKTFVERFDRGLSVDPFDFEFDLDDKVEIEMM